MKRVWILGLLISLGFLNAQPQITFTEFSLSNPASGPFGIVTGPDGALWFTEIGADQIGRITTAGVIAEYALPTKDRSPWGITVGPDGALWFAIESQAGGPYVTGQGMIGRITTGGAITEYLVDADSQPGFLTTGPDGALWFTETTFSSGKIARITTSGAIAEYPFPNTGSFPLGIVTGADGAMWFGLSNGMIGRITIQGAITEYQIPTAGAYPQSIIAGPDGALWFTEGQTNEIGRITTSGVITEYPIPFPASYITAGPDGAVWFASLSTSSGETSFGRITPVGATTEYPFYSYGSFFSPIVGMTFGPDGALWFTDANGKIGRAVASVAASPVITVSSPPAGLVGFLYFAQLSATRGIPSYENWTVVDGSLPPGLALDSATGVISGIPISEGAYRFSVTAQDSTGAVSVASIVTITISPPLGGLSFTGLLPHLAAEENWTTTFTLVNKAAAPATARLSLFGDPSGTLAIPLTFPQQPAANPLLTASFDQTISANASLIVKTAGPQKPPVQVGSAQLLSTGAVDGFAIFHHVITQQETVVPLETRNPSSYILPFDNTGGSVLGVALANASTDGQVINVWIRDDHGAIVQTPSIPIPAVGHVSFVLPLLYPITANARGTLEFLVPSGAQIGVLGMRFTPPNNALTTIPAFARGTVGGGSIAHIATGNGWQSTFVLVNTGTAAAPFQLNFFADDGTPLPLPVGFPQSTSGTTAVTSSVQQTMAPNSILLIQSAAPLSDAAPTQGSAQLTASGNISGFVIYRYNPNGQEAVVPFENRNGSGYILAFDNTAGTATGVAVNNATAQASSVPVIIRDDTGAQIATDTIQLAPNGHSAFTLVTDKYPQTANIRGTIEFDTPPGGSIGALAFRIPVAHTFTTLPALAR